MAPPGFFDLRDARRRVGQRVVANWQKEGAGEYAPSASEDAAEMRAIAEMDDRQLKAAARAHSQKIAKQEQDERAAGAPQSGRKEAAEQLRARMADLVAAFQPPPGSAREQQRARREYRSRLEKLLANLEAPMLPAAGAKPRAARDTRAELEATRTRLMDEAAARHEQHQAARLRWATADAIVRDKATRGAWRVFAQLAPPLAEVLRLTADELPALWPKPNETHVTVPYDGMSVRARLLIAEAEIDRDFPPEAPPEAAKTASSAPESGGMIAPNGPSAAPKNDARTGKHNPSTAPKQPQRGIWQPSLKQYMQINRGRLENLDDDEIVGLFRRHMSEQHSKIPLERRRDRIRAKVESVRRDLGWVPAAASGEQTTNGG